MFAGQGSKWEWNVDVVESFGRGLERCNWLCLDGCLCGSEFFAARWAPDKFAFLVGASVDGAGMVEHVVARARLIVVEAAALFVGSK